MSTRGHSVKTVEPTGTFRSKCYWQERTALLEQPEPNTNTSPLHCYWPAAGHGRVCGPDSASLWRTRWRACSGWAGRWSPPPSPSSPRWWWWSEQTPVQLHKKKRKRERHQTHSLFRSIKGIPNISFGTMKITLTEYWNARKWKKKK